MDKSPTTATEPKTTTKTQTAIFPSSLMDGIISGVVPNEKVTIELYPTSTNPACAGYSHLYFRGRVLLMGEYVRSEWR